MMINGAYRNLVYEIASGALLFDLQTEFQTIGGMAFGISSGMLYFVDEVTNTLNQIQPNAIDGECANPIR